MDMVYIRTFVQFFFFTSLTCTYFILVGNEMLLPGEA